MSEARMECTGKLKPDYKSDCKHPLMIIRSGPTVRDGRVYQVVAFGCLNPDCSLFNQEITREEHEWEQF